MFNNYIPVPHEQRSVPERLSRRQTHCTEVWSGFRGRWRRCRGQRSTWSSPEWEWSIALFLANVPKSLSVLNVKQKFCTLSNCQTFGDIFVLKSVRWNWNQINVAFVFRFRLSHAFYSICSILKSKGINFIILGISKSNFSSLNHYCVLDFFKVFKIETLINNKMRK